MAIRPPSDIVLEVAQAADPERLQVATAKLNKLGEATGPVFAQALEKVQPARWQQLASPSGGKTVAADIREPSPTMPFDVARARLDLRNDTSRLQQAAQANADPGNRAKVMEDFEAMVLQTFISSMLPQDAEQVYGEGTAGSIWKSMLAEQIGKQMAKAGGIGIADRILSANADLSGAARAKGGVDLAALGVGKQGPQLPAASLSAILANSSRI